MQKRDYKIDGLKWLKDESVDDSDDTLEPEELVTDAITELESAVLGLKAVLLQLESIGQVVLENTKES